MILLMAGSSEAREALSALLKDVDRVLVTTATDYPYPLDSDNRVEVRQGRLDREQMVGLIRSEGVSCLVDATHPFAAEASSNAMMACREAAIPYIRFERKLLPLPQSDLVHCVENVEAAARLSCCLGETIFLSTGTKDLEVFCRMTSEKDRKLIVRVLPSAESMERCVQAGIEPDDIIAMKGPFSTRMNAVLWSELNVDAVVAKESGEEGGLGEKAEAVLELGIHLVVVKRPVLDYPVCFQEAESLRSYLREQRII